MMIFTLNSYRDLGRCSYGTLRNQFDTEKDSIYLHDYKIEVEKIEDLFPFLWQSEGVGGFSDGKSFAYFSDMTTHWHRDLDDRIEEEAKEIKKLKTKIEKSKDKKRTETLKEKLNMHEQMRISMLNLCDILDKEMEDQKVLLIEENRK